MSDLFRGINKATLCEYMGVEENKKVKKGELEEQLLAEFTKNVDARKKFLEDFEHATALYPSDLESALGCTKTERLRWTNEGKLKVVGYDSFKYGEFPIFSRYQVEFLITPEEVASWREKHEAEKKSNAARAIKKAQRTRKDRDKKKESILEDLAEQKKKWLGKDAVLAATFELAFWTVWMSRLAKFYQVKGRHGRIKSMEKYSSMENECYGLKDKALRELIKSPYARVSFYRPEDSDKPSVGFCEYHYEHFRETRSNYPYGTYGAWDYFHSHKKEILNCPECDYDNGKDYYSLYYVEIEDNDCADTRFSFHVPYPVAVSYMGEPNKYPQVEHEEQDGMFRFGRPLEDEEQYIFTKAFVAGKFNKVYEAYVKAISELL